MLPVTIGLVMGLFIGMSSRGASMSTLQSRVVGWVLLGYAIGIGGFIFLGATATAADYGEWLPLDEAARYAKVPPQKILDLISSGALKSTTEGSKVIIERRALDRLNLVPDELPPLRS
jgi:hypothetical protein